MYVTARNVAILLICCVASGVGGFYVGSQKNRSLALLESKATTLLAIRHAYQLDVVLSTLEILERGDTKYARSFLEAGITADLSVLQDLQHHVDGASKTMVREAFDRGTAYAQEHDLR